MERFAPLALLAWAMASAAVVLWLVIRLWAHAVVALHPLFQ